MSRTSCSCVDPTDVCTVLYYSCSVTVIRPENYIYEKIVPVGDTTSIVSDNYPHR